jgi:hypothetical protein
MAMINLKLSCLIRIWRIDLRCSSVVMVFLVCHFLHAFPLYDPRDFGLIVDLSAAAHADVLFTKVMANGDSDLMAYCKREHIPHVPFTDL